MKTKCNHTLRMRRIFPGSGLSALGHRLTPAAARLLAAAVCLFLSSTTTTARLVFAGSRTLPGTWSLNLETGSITNNQHIFWEQIDGERRQMVPWCAGIVNLGVVDFESFTLSDLQKLPYSSSPINASEDSNQLVPNDVFAVMIRSGTYALVKVLEYGYNIRLRWETYDANTPPTLGVLLDRVGVDEAGGPAMVKVGTRENLKAAVTLDFATVDGKAKAGEDYGANSGTLRFNAGEHWKSIEIPILNDGIREDSESFRVLLSNVSGGASLGPNSNSIVTIHYNDLGFNFAQFTWTVDESAGEAVITVLRQDDAGGTATVDYTTIDDTAKAGLDYTSVSGTLTFALGQTNQTITIPVSDNSVRDDTKTFEVLLSHPSPGTTLGATSVAQVNIQNDDPASQGFLPSALGTNGIVLVSPFDTYYDGWWDGRLSPALPLSSDAARLQFVVTGGVATDWSGQIASPDGIPSDGWFPSNFLGHRFAGTYRGVPVGGTTGIAPALFGVFFSFTYEGRPSDSLDYRPDSGLSTDPRTLTVYHPELNQPFWIGNGAAENDASVTLNDKFIPPGEIQTFVIPVGATHLLLGLGADSLLSDNQGYEGADIAFRVQVFDDSRDLTSPVIVAQPQNQEAFLGARAELAVRVHGATPLAYQWQRHGLALNDGGRIAGARTATLTITDIGFEDVGFYSVLVSNSFGSVASGPAALSVTVASPQITAQPQGQLAALGSAVSFDVEAVGSLPLAYQWQFNGADLADGPLVSGAQTRTLRLPHVGFDDAGAYSVLVSNAYGVLMSAAAVLSVEPAIQYVNAANPTPQPPYATWETAATNIQDAIQAGTIANRLVLVTNGLYATGSHSVEGDPALNRVAVLKPVTVQSVNGPQFTIIQGVRPSGEDDPEPPIRCVYLTGGASLVGFTLTNGAADSGGGVLCASSGATLTNCILAGNSAVSGGGAYGGTLYDCTLLGNSASLSGGGAQNSTLSHCTIARNSAGGNGSSFGGGTDNCGLERCTLEGNSAHFGGGANASTLEGCLVISNSATASGGGAYHSSLNNCTLIRNSANAGGGGVFDSTVNQCTLVRNHAQNGGGALYGTLNNCTLTGNSAYYTGGGAGVDDLSPDWGLTTLNNCIIYFNTAQYGANCGYNASLSYCCTTRLPPNGVGNIANAPLFLDHAHDDLRLASNSPCINGGSNSYVPGQTDLDGNPRIVSGTVDIGAYEYQGPGSRISYAWLQESGLPTDGSADYADTDGDGMNNWQEWLCGTFPTDQDSALRLISVSSDGTNVAVTWQSAATLTYFLERSTNLAFPFTRVAAGISGQAGTTTYTDPNAASLVPLFYRVGVASP
jgi:hypothetical protein